MVRHDTNTDVRIGGVGDLVVRARDGDAAAWARLVEELSPLLWAVARSHGLNDADSRDVVQTTWLRLVEHIDAVRDAGAIRAWLARTARHESLRLVRAHGRAFPACGPAPAADPGPGPAEIALARDRLDRVGAALQELPRRCGTLLRLYAQAATYEELAAALGIPLGSVGPTRARCLETLRRLLR
ncbi:RNA polymerase sigma factor [Actinomadura sp. WMMB 499]|uniref:RNA polymerase sigma factor n=1 Tax=Actinomadura sp. WMMB 499 TaxID=1219491 RepID=UPI001245191A|nr:sigma-70 family RNA polymerase sigma factor [Actinomadura sp. WMMB 499]QFG20952.1 sigma-70 family RNA polymerase sigma factor [Actinomadura sp. WMMB 499]